MNQIVKFQAIKTKTLKPSAELLEMHSGVIVFCRYITGSNHFHINHNGFTLLM